MADLTLTTISNGQTNDATPVMSNFNAIKSLIENLDKDNLSAALQDLLVPSGSIVATGRSTAPSGYLLCDGSAVSRTDYAALFTAIGTAYGVGDGVNTFNLPNLKGKVPVGRDAAQTEFDTLGETGGAKTHTLTGAQSGIKAHTHGDSFSIASGGAHDHTVRFDGPGGGTVWRDTDQQRSFAAPTVSTPTVSTSSGGDNQLVTSSDGSHGHTLSGSVSSKAAEDAAEAHQNLQPYQVVNHIIKV